MTHTVRVDDRGYVEVDETRLPAHLSYKEIAVLRSILSRRSVTTKEALLTDLYGGRDEPQLKIVDVFVCKVRHKLGAHAGMIETVWGRGYSLHPDYAPAPDLSGGMLVQLNGKLSQRLDEAAFESNQTPTDLANLLLADAVRTYRANLWAA